MAEEKFQQNTKSLRFLLFVSILFLSSETGNGEKLP
jgi:hypothetical protein